MDARAQKLWLRGMAHFRQGNMEAAQANFEAFLAHEPDSGPARFRLSMVHAQRGRYLTAIALARQAQTGDPDRIEVLIHLARCYLMCGQPELARALATRALALPKDNPVLFDALGVVMTRLDEQVLALELFNQAIALEPNQASMYFNRALAQKQFGMNAGAGRDLETCIAMHPAHAKAHWHLATLETQDLGHNHLARLRQRLARPLPAAADDEFLSLALFKELDDLSEVGAAWPALERGIVSRRGRWSALEDRQSRRLHSLMAMGGELFSNARPILGPDASPVFVFGMPRSGVALLGNLLARHPRVHHLGQQQPFSRLLAEQLGWDSVQPFDATAIEQCLTLDFGELGRRYLAAVSPTEGKQLLICESKPMNFQLAGFIALALPSARILHIVRDPIDNCVSILGHAGGESSLPSHDPGLLASYYLDYQRLMQHWHQVLPIPIMDVDYQSLVEKPDMVLRVICSFLGIRYGSALRTGLQLHRRSIGRGQRYAPYLSALRAGLGRAAVASRSQRLPESSQLS